MMFLSEKAVQAYKWQQSCNFLLQCKQTHVTHVCFKGELTVLKLEYIKL